MGTFVPATDVTGWSTYTSTPPASIYYISKAAGASDTNTGLAPTFTAGINGPFSTLTQGLIALNALSAGTEAWLLLREGDTWAGDEFGNLTLSGPSSSNPVVISSYHTSVPNTFHPAIAARPLLRPTANQTILRFRGNNLAVIGLDIYCISRDPNGGAFVDGNQGASAFYSLENNSSIRLEDVQIRFCGSGLSFSNGTVDGVTLHRCCISDNYAYSQAAQGLLVQWINSTISECVWDHNGWNASVPTSYNSGAGRNRNIYIASYTAPWARQPVVPSGPCTIKNNIISSDGSGTQPRCGGPLTNNLFVRNPYAVNYGMPIAGGNDVSRNVILSGVLDPNGFAVFGGFSTFGPSQGDDSTLGSVNFHDNIIAHTIDAVQNGVVLDRGVNGCTVDQNIFYQWNCTGAKISLSTGSLKTVGSLGSITAGSGYTRGALFTGRFSATFTATGSGTNITITGLSGYLSTGASLANGIGDAISGTGVPAGVVLAAQSSGTTGSNGTYVTGVFNAVFTGSGSGTNLSVSAFKDQFGNSTGTIYVGDLIFGTGVPASTSLASQTSGIYTTNNVITSSGAAITSSNGATFTGTGSGSTITATGITGRIRLGDTITGVGVPAGTVITGHTSGVYVTNNSTTSSGNLKAYTPTTITSSSAALTSTTKILNVTAVASGGLYIGQCVVGDVSQSVYLGVAQGCIIMSQLTGTAHGVGTYDTDILFAPQGAEFVATFLSTETWYNVPLTNVSGIGNGAIANITVGPGGGVTAVELFIGTTFENPTGGCCGTGYAVGNDLSATPSAPFYTNVFTWGGFSNSTGSGFQVHIDAVATNTIGTNPIDAGGYPDPTRTIESYDLNVLGGPGTFAHFIGLAKANCKFNWDPRYTANAVNSYVRAGFGIGSQVQRLSLRFHA